MTPREALESVRAGLATEEALESLERLVSKDEADREYEAQRNRRPAFDAPHCTCGTIIPCAILGHS